MPKVLVSDPIAPEGIEILKRVADVDVKTGLPKEELAAIIGDYDALAVRSETKVTADVIATAKNLKIIGRAGVGVDNIDVEAATKRGILVVNSPEGNTIAAAELTVAMLLALARNIPQADAVPARRRVEALQVHGVRGLRQDPGRHRPGQDRPRSRQAPAVVRDERHRLRPVSEAGAGRSAGHQAGGPGHALQRVGLHHGPRPQDQRNGGHDQRREAGADEADRAADQCRARRHH